MTHRQEIFRPGNLQFYALLSQSMQVKEEIIHAWPMNWSSLSFDETGILQNKNPVATGCLDVEDFFFTWHGISPR